MLGAIREFERSLILSSLRQAASPTSIVALRDPASSTTADNAPTDLVYLSSRFGDSQLVRLEGLTSGAVELQLVASYSSLAPITDCCLIQDETGGAVCFHLP